MNEICYSYVNIPVRSKFKKKTVSIGFMTSLFKSSTLTLDLIQYRNAVIIQIVIQMAQINIAFKFSFFPQ